MAIVAINGWNRLAISFRNVPGTYQPATRESRTVPSGRMSPALPRVSAARQSSSPRPGVVRVR